MNGIHGILLLFRLAGVLVMMSAAVYACWLLSGQQFPKHVGSWFGWTLLVVLWGLGG
jgi:hypothetical protein